MRMVKNILLILGLFGMGSLHLQADYVIQLGVFKNKNSLVKNIERISDETLRANVSIKKQKGLYWAHSKTYTDKKSMQRDLAKYRKHIKDAFGKKVSTQKASSKKEVSVTKKKTTEKVTTPVVSAIEEKPKKVAEPKAVATKEEKQPESVTTQVEEKSVAPVEEEDDFALDILAGIEMQKEDEGDLPQEGEDSSQGHLASLLQGKVFYVCAEDKSKEIIKMNFDTKRVTYSGVFETKHKFKANYKVHNGHLYLFRGDFSAQAVYLKLEQQSDQYLLMRSQKGEKQGKAMRYYKELHEAMDFMQEG